MNFTFTNLDLFIIIVYIAAIVAYGFYHRKAGSSEDYFLAGRNMPWYVIGISMFSANISSNSLIAITGKNLAKSKKQVKNNPSDPMKIPTSTQEGW